MPAVSSPSARGKDLLTAQEVARRLSIGVRTLWRLVAQETCLSRFVLAGSSSVGRLRILIVIFNRCPLEFIAFKEPRTK